MLAVLEPSHIPILLVIGFAVLAGASGARVFQWLRIPQVVGYIAVGVAIGRSGFRLIDSQVIDGLLPFSFFALGVIGFMIGRELQAERFRRFGRQFTIIMIAEGTGAFLLVGAGVTAVMFLVTHSLQQALAYGLVLGAISSATAPAATVDVLWEYKSRGPLTTTVFAIVAMDDAFALFLFSVVSSIAVGLMSGESGGLLGNLGHTAWELLGGAGLGALAGFALNQVLRLARDYDKALTFTLGALALVLGLATWLKVDLILASMALGMTLANLAPRRSGEAFRIMERFAPPIYVLFFVLVGAQLNVAGLPAWMWGLAGAYVLSRTVGKLSGAYLGARLARAPAVLRKYLGLCLFSQAGVAIGLAILAGIRFRDVSGMGNNIVMVVTATTLIVQIIGPPCVKAAIFRAGEAGMDVTEEDLMESYRVRDVMDADVPTVAERTTLVDILNLIARSDTFVYPVVDEDGLLSGQISIQHLRQFLSSHDLTHWMVAYDLMDEVPDVVSADTPLSEAVTRMREQGLDSLPVTRSADSRELAGTLELRKVNHRLTQEVLRRRSEADGT
jgi:Kef-type K+ transport system membrane component KefB